MDNQIGIEPNNPATQLANWLKEQNQNRGALAGRNVGTPTMQRPRVTTAPMMAPPELTPEEKRELDIQAVNAGVLSADEVPDYPGKNLMIEVEKIPSWDPSEHRLPEKDFISRATPRLPDFSRVQGLDLERGVAMIDGFEIPLPEADIDKNRTYIIGLAKEYFNNKLTEALAQYGKSDSQEEKTKKVQRKRKRNSKAASE